MATPPTKSPPATPTPAPAPAPTPAAKPKPPPPATTPAGQGPPTNGKKAIITNSLWDIQLAESSGKPLKYYAKGEAGEEIADDNHVETWKAIPTQTCTHTYVRKFLVVHHETKIGHSEGPGPSWYASNLEKLGAPPHGVGVKGKKVQFYAQALEHSKDVRVEGHWLVREHDTTNQDNANGKGKFVYAKGLTEVPDDSDLLFMQCAVSKLRLECKHPEDEKDKPPAEKRFITFDPNQPKEKQTDTFEVFIGDEVTVWATRMNAAETDPAAQKKPKCDFALYKEKRKPPKEETKHAAFLLSRNEVKWIPGVTDGWSLKENVTIVGDDVDDPDQDKTAKDKWKATKIVLGADWLLKDPAESGISLLEEPGTGDIKDKEMEELRLRSLSSAETQRNTASRAADLKDQERTNNSDRLAGQRWRAERQASTARDAHAADAEKLSRARAAKRVNEFGKSIYTGVKTWQALAGFLGFAPLTLKVNAHGCSKGPTATIKAYPAGAVELDLWALKDLPIKKPLESVKDAVNTFKQFLKYIRGSKVKGHGAADEAGEADASITAGAFTIGFYFCRRSKTRTNDGKGWDPTPREDDDMEPKLAFSAEYKELDRAVPEKGLAPWMVKRKFSLDIGIERLIGLFFKANIPLAKLSFLAAIAELIEYLDIEAGPYMSMELSLSLGVVGKFSRDEYGEWVVEPGEIPLCAKIEFKLYLKLTNALEIGVSVSGTWSPKYMLRRNEKSQQVCLEADKSQFVILSEAYANIDIGIWSGSFKAEIYKWPIDIAATSWPLFGQS